MAWPWFLLLPGSRPSRRSSAGTLRRLLNPRRAVSQDGFDPLFLVVGPLLVLAIVHAIALAITHLTA